MKTVYDLALALADDPKRVADTQALTQDTSKPLMGLAGKYGLFGSAEWWGNLKSGVIPIVVYEGIIESLQFEGMHNEGRSFTLRLGDGGTYTYSCMANKKQDLKAYRVGQNVRVTMLSERKKNDETLEMVWTVEIEHD